jgi:hypothetical protein
MTSHLDIVGGPSPGAGVDLSNGEGPREGPAGPFREESAASAQSPVVLIVNAPQPTWAAAKVSSTR